MKRGLKSMLQPALVVVESGSGRTDPAFFEVPDGVEIIERCAFKDCANIEMLILPATIKQIKLNAFYRATSLKRIVNGCKQENLTFEGFYGDYENVQPKWFYPE